MAQATTRSWRGRRWLGPATACLFALAGAISLVWTPYPLDAANAGEALQNPGASHLLGTDAAGRDIVSLLMRSLLSGLTVSVAATLAAGFIGIPLGYAAARLEGATAWLASRVAAFLNAVPPLVLAVLIGTIAGPTTAGAILAIGLANIGVLARVTRSAVSAVHRQDFAAAARLAGLGQVEIGVRHVLPSLTRPLAAPVLLLVANGVLAEAALSYVGLAVQPPGVSFGLLLRDAQSLAFARPLLLIAPGLALLLLVLALRSTGRLLDCALSKATEGAYDDAA